MKYVEITRDDTLQDDPSPHSELGMPSTWERHELSLCLSRKGLSQIARFMFLNNLV